MAALTRRRSPDAPDECWHVYFGDVRVGTIAIRTGIPPHEDPWGWACGFYPGSHPGNVPTAQLPVSTRPGFDFEDAWRVFLSKRTEADFETWRAQRDWTTRKYAMWRAGERMPSQKPSSLMTCRCGEVFDSHRLEDTLESSFLISARPPHDRESRWCVLAPKASGSGLRGNRILRAGRRQGFTL